MSYFYEVVTKGTIPNFESAGRAHREALNTYINTTGPTGKQRNVKEMNTVQTVLDGNPVIATTTFLCCDDDE